MTCECEHEGNGKKVFKGDGVYTFKEQDAVSLSENSGVGSCDGDEHENLYSDRPARKPEPRSE